MIEKKNKNKKKEEGEEDKQEEEEEEDYVYFSSCGGFPEPVQLRLMDGAVNAGNGKRTQREIKFVFLSLLSFHLFSFWRCSS